MKKNKLILTITSSCLVIIGCLIALAVFKILNSAVLNPEKFEEIFKTKLTETTHINVRPVWLDDPAEEASVIVTKPGDEHCIFTERRQDKIKELIERFEVRPLGYGPSCNCGGSHALDFYHDEQYLASVTLHHGNAFRGLDGWKGNINFTDSYATLIREWFAEYDITNLD